MSLRFPHDGLTLLPLVSSENDSPRWAGQVWAGACGGMVCKIRIRRFKVTHETKYENSQQLVAFKFEHT